MRFDPGNFTGKGTVGAGRYRIERRISRQGTTAQVYLAADTLNPGRQVALKCARAAGPDRHIYQDHLRHEASVLQALAHPGVVRLYPALGEDVFVARAESLPGQAWYFVMDYLPGGSLAGEMRRIRRRSPDWRISLFYQILEGVRYLHDSGWAHSDLKPDHILFRQPITDDYPPQAVLIDFGCAAPLDEPVTYPALSIPYTAPELLRALHGDSTPLLPAPLDVWALGVILYEISTGRRLVRGWTRRGIMRRILRGHFDLDAVPLTPPLRALLDAMLHPDPAQRPSVAEIYETNR